MIACLYTNAEIGVRDVAIRQKWDGNVLCNPLG